MITLCLSAFAGAITVLALAFTTADWSFGGLALVCGIAGVTVTSWNGVHLAEVARLAPRHRVSEATSGGAIVTFMGYVIGPSGFAMVLALTDSYRLAFGIVAFICLIAVVALWPIVKFRRA